MGKSYLITSGKGGTGKSMFSVNMGYTLADKGFSVVLIDLDMGMRCLDLYLGLENNIVYDLSDVLKGVCRIKQAMVKDRKYPNLFLIPAPPERDNGEITPLHLKVLADKLKEKFDYVIIDGPAGNDDNLVIASAGADEAIIVTTPEYASVRDADLMAKNLAKLGFEKVNCVVNKVDAQLIEDGFAPSLSEINRQLKMEVIGLIQKDDNIHISTNIGVPICCKPDTYIKENFDNIVKRIE
ncbi:MAG: septum site-determining protein MinD [Clostridia bacterium]|nr:septum site-determining protein MinD [Clostridia bacterium]